MITTLDTYFKTETEIKTEEKDVLKYQAPEESNSKKECKEKRICLRRHNNHSKMDKKRLKRSIRKNNQIQCNKWQIPTRDKCENQRN